MRFTRQFRPDLLAIIEGMEKREHFAFARFNTGEWPMVIGQRAEGRGSGWVADPERNARYYSAMQAAWQCNAAGWTVGISCPCCNPPQHLWYEKYRHVPAFKATFATIFMGANWPIIRDWLKAHRNEYVLVGPHKCDFDVPENCFGNNWDWTQLRENLATINGNTPILFAAGPLGKILCHQMLGFHNGPLVDIGSALDLDMFGHPTRAYLRTPAKKTPRSKVNRKLNDRVKRLWRRTCKWQLAKKPVHK